MARAMDARKRVAFLAEILTLAISDLLNRFDLTFSILAIITESPGLARLFSKKTNFLGLQTGPMSL